MLDISWLLSRGVLPDGKLDAVWVVIATIN